MTRPALPGANSGAAYYERQIDQLRAEVAQARASVSTDIGQSPVSQHTNSEVSSLSERMLQVSRS